MNIDEIRREIDELSLLVAGWIPELQPSQIEKDVVLFKLRRLYDNVMFLTVSSQEADSSELPEQVSEVVVPYVVDIDIDAVSLVEPEVEVAPEPEPEPEPEVEVAPQRRQDGDNLLFDIDTIPKQKRRRSVLMSLYDDDASLKAKSGKITKKIVSKLTGGEKVTPPSEEPKSEDSSINPIIVGDFTAPITTLADTYTNDVETIADRISNHTTHQTLSDAHVYRSFEELGINERYLLARDLFGDDPHLCHEVLAKIDGFDNYDDAIIYIAENFNWDPDGEATKLLLSILEHKFNIN
ncbi:MAG: hypothetical protein SNH73_01795 [Rikenellaceae bacterium]